MYRITLFRQGPRWLQEGNSLPNIDTEVCKVKIWDAVTLQLNSLVKKNCFPTQSSKPIFQWLLKMNKVLGSSDSCENIQKQKPETKNKQFLVAANYKDGQFRCLGQEDPWKRKWLPIPVFLPRKSHEQRSLVGCSPWGCKESDMTEDTNTHSSGRT